MRIKGSSRDGFYFYIFIMPWIIGFLAFTLYPLISSFYYSLTEYNSVNPPVFVGLKNYNALFGDDLFFRSIKATVYYTFISVPVSIVISLSFAMLLNQKVRFQNFFRTALYMPSMISGVTMSLLWIWLFNPHIGLINYMLSLIGIKGPGWISSERWAIPSLIIMSLWNMGAGMVIFLAGLKSVPAIYYEAAKLDGANAFQKFWRITLPSISPVFLFQLLMNIIDSFQVFTPAYVMTQGGPHYATLFYVYYLYTSAFLHQKIGYSSALGWLLLVVVTAISYLIIRSSSRFVHYEGGKNA